MCHALLIKRDKVCRAKRDMLDHELSVIFVVFAADRNCNSGTINNQNRYY